MLPILNTLLPVFALILIGYALGRSAFPTADFWRGAARLTYFVLLPALLLNRIATASLAGFAIGRLMGALAAAILLLALGLLLLRASLAHRLQLQNAAFTSLFQGSIRQNTYVGLAVATAFYGAEGAAYAAIGVGTIVPLVNLLSVGVLARYTEETGSTVGWGEMALAIARNPLILACLLGALLNLLRIGLPLGGEQTVAILGQAALPLGLLTVGAGLKPRSMGRFRTRILLSSLLKLIVLPCLFLIIAWLLDLRGTALMVGLILSALPTAASSYILAQQMGGDQPLMAAILTAQTAFACITMLLLLTVANVLFV